ncbi:MAG: N-acetylmuramoyl-L-alanine amidase [Maribacter sp.]
MNRIFICALVMLALLFTSFSNNNELERNDGKFVVVLDAGHGGHDPGNLGNGYLEKNIALNIVLNVGKILEKDPDIKVIYTRKTDRFVDLFVRGEIANKANADLFVSIHCDSHSSDAHGAGTFVLGLHANKQNFEIAKKENSVIYLEDNYEVRYADYDINSPESIIGLTIMQEEFLDQSIALAKMIQDNFTGKLKRNNRKVKQAGFIVLHQTFMPSVLIETGFLTNKSEGSYLNSAKGQLQIGSEIANAIIKYKSGVQSNVSETIEQIASNDNVPVEEAPVNEEVIQEMAEKPLEQKEIPVKEEIEEKIEPEKAIITSDAPNNEKVESIAEDLSSKEITVEKEESAPPEKKEDPSSSTRIIFKVQLLASSKDMPLQSENFNGLGRLSKEPYKNLYRYMYGITDSYKEAEMLKSNADIKGYTSSYIVAYKEGTRIPVPEALKYVSE